MRKRYEHLQPHDGRNETNTKQPGPQVIKLCFMLNPTEHEPSTAHKKLKYRNLKKFLALSLSDVVFIMLINVKMPTIVGILTFMSRINFVLSCVRHRKVL